MTNSLTDFCDLISNQVNPQELPEATCIGLEHITSGRFLRGGGARAGESHSSKFSFRKGDILYSKLRPYLDKAVIADSDGLCTTELLVLRPKGSVSARFLACVVHSPTFIENAMSGVTGAHHPRTSWQRISEFRLKPFSPEEQDDIADIVWLVHDLLQANEKLVLGLNSLKRSAARALYTRGIHDEACKNTDIGEMPISWSVGRLARYASVISTRMSYSQLEATVPYDGANPSVVLGIKVSDMNLPGNEIFLNESSLQRSINPEVAARSCAPPFSILFPKRGAAISTNKKRLSTTWTVFDPNIIGVRSGPELDQRFLFQWFQTFDLRKIAEGGPTPQLNKKDLDPLLIPIPPTLIEQSSIADALEAIDKRISIHVEKSRVLEKLLRLLLHKLITAELNPSELDLSALNPEKLEEVGV